MSQPASEEPLADHIRQTRDRFLALALAGAELSLEATPEGKVTFAVGTAMALVGKGAKAIEAGTVFDLFQPADHPRLTQALSRMREGRRISGIALSVPLPDGGQHEVWLSGYQMPGELDSHLFLALETRPILPPPPAVRLPDPASNLPGREDFASIARARLSEATHAGLAYDLTLLDLPEVRSLDPEAAETFRRDLADFLRAHSVGGESAGWLSETKYGVVHGGELSEQVLKDKIGELAERALPGGRKLGVQMATLDLDKAGVSEEEAVQALVYTINQFTRQEGSAFTVEALSQGVHSALSDTVSEMGRLKAMIAEGRFELAYQPVVSLASNIVHHFECLARLNAQQSGEASPFRLVTFAEDTGLIGQLDRAIYERVIDLLHKNFMGDRAVSLAVNLSGRSVADKGFMNALFKALDEAPPFGERLLFEMTESAEVRDLSAANAVLQKLRSHGHPVCLDDFGAGNAAFHYLRALKVDFVKIDGSYVQNVLTHPQDVPFLKAIAQLCRDLKVNMIAEMIEDKDTAELLKSLGVQYGQGYYFGRPAQALEGGKKTAAPAGFVRQDGHLVWTG